MRWSGAPRSALGWASTEDAEVRLGSWSLRRDGDIWRSVVEAGSFRLDLAQQRTQPLLLQGDAGFSRKGPEERQASHYFSCLLYTSDAADERSSVELGGRRIIKKKQKKHD